MFQLNTRIIFMIITTMGITTGVSYRLAARNKNSETSKDLALNYDMHRQHSEIDLNTVLILSRKSACILKYH